MLNDSDSIQVVCDNCGATFIKQVSWFRTNTRFKCIGDKGCGKMLQYDSGDLVRVLTEHATGRFPELRLYPVEK